MLPFLLIVCTRISSRGDRPVGSSRYKHDEIVRLKNTDTEEG